MCLWATGFIGARLGMPHAEPATFLSLRFVLAFAALGAIAVLSGAPWPRGRAAWGAVLVGALVHGIYLLGVFWAIDRGMPAGVAAVVVGLQPLLTALAAGLWLSETVTGHHRIGLALGLLGVVLVLLPGGLTGLGDGITIATVAATLLAAFAVTAGTVLQKAVGAESDLRTGTALQYAGALAVTGAFALAFEEGRIAWTGEAVLALAWLVVVLSIAAVLLLMHLIAAGSVAQVSALFYLVPAVAAAMARALFGETLSAIQLTGMALCALAVWLATRKPHPRVRAA